MEDFFIIRLGEDEYSNHLEYDEMAIEYCVDILDIPEEKIEGVNILSDHKIELTLQDLEKEDVTEDWYVNLHKISD
ncbi:MULTISPECIES: hypothetical protein [Malaciobacter]|jgi:hypothetical protein|uniref:Uncharacterized protein n=2 Tax=Malaciobacter TaxID=2321114 RepID=A0AB36ZTT3_9BACT|nr:MULTISPECIES: hypothetical protein [Malaciobacter]PHO10056.1 hypothetical protein CPG37_06865 [Malaciobacter canalis]PPK57481.1 hypothetical protein B0F89_1484 [Malaciobacter marinus]QEE33646.1 hypothetical protein ACAN_2196 [Malaciobacter canalis]SKB25255.1 hypothetical protein SAMN06295997_101172 [Malaciobacter marinus]